MVTIIDVILIIENNIQQKLCWCSIWIARSYVRQFKILRYKRHVMWKKVPEKEIGVTYRWNLKWIKFFIHSVSLCSLFAVTQYILALSIINARSGIKPNTPCFFSCYLIIHFPIINNRLHIPYFAERGLYSKHYVFSVRYEMNVM